MAELDKVIKCLELCRKLTNSCEGCPYENVPAVENCMLTMHGDALELLKEQEAVEPISEHHLFLCPVCKNTLFREQKFCHECGKRIEWEGR